VGLTSLQLGALRRQPPCEHKVDVDWDAVADDAHSRAACQGKDFLRTGVAGWWIKELGSTQRRTSAMVGKEQATASAALMMSVVSTNCETGHERCVKCYR
jgi:hypothetical protein